MNKEDGAAVMFDEGMKLRTPGVIEGEGGRPARKFVPNVLLISLGAIDASNEGRGGANDAD